MAFIGRDNQAAVSCADGYLTVWNLETYKLLRYVRLRDVQVGLRFCPTMDVLTSWGVDEFNHEFFVWDVDKLAVLHALNGHSEAVKDIYEVAPPSASRDPDLTEKTWDPILGEDPAVLWIHNARVFGQNVQVCICRHSRQSYFCRSHVFFMKPSHKSLLVHSWIFPSPTLPARISYAHGSAQYLDDNLRS